MSYMQHGSRTLDLGYTNYDYTMRNVTHNALSLHTNIYRRLEIISYLQNFMKSK